MAQEQYLSSVLPQDHQAALESFKLVQLLMVMASYWKVQGWLEQMRQLKETEDQVSAAKRNILQAVTLALEEHDVQEEKIEGVDEAGAETLLGTITYDVNKMIAQTFHAQHRIAPGNCWAFQGSQGHVVTCRGQGCAKGILGLASTCPFPDTLLGPDLLPLSLVLEGVDEAGAETLLGTFTYDVNKMIAQTFHAQGVDEAGAETLLGTFTYDVNKMIAQTFHAQSMWLAEDLPERDTLKELSLLMPPASPSEDPLPLKLA
ncbi:hypothetical protein Q9966_014392 [Columba livia]|nr:hypothetical protein Q9966_014392 [Columba livia]